MNLSLVARLLAAAICLSFAACSGIQAGMPETVAIPKRVELAAGDSNTLNYTPWYFHTFEIEGPPGSGIRGGGGNTWPMSEDGSPGQGGGVCCTTYPAEWQPDLTLTVRWKVDKKQDGKTPGYWYKAENVRVERYIAHQTAGVWAIFLPGDRVKVIIGNPDAYDLAPGAGPPASTDPYVSQGTLDDQWNRLYRVGGDSQ
jgi:hypothetical protein